MSSSARVVFNGIQSLLQSNVNVEEISKHCLPSQVLDSKINTQVSSLCKINSTDVMKSSNLQFFNAYKNIYHNQWRVINK